MQKRKVIISVIVIIAVAVMVICKFGSFFQVNAKEQLNEKILTKWDEDCSQIRIAILDSGINSELSTFDSADIRDGWNFILECNNTKDTSGHGTSVSSILCSEEFGICKDAQIYPLVVLDKYGNGRIEDVCEAIEWCIINEMDVINISFSTPTDSEKLYEVITRAVDEGIVIVASYDNNGGDSYPAQYENVIGVMGSSECSIKLNDGIAEALGKSVHTISKDGKYQMVDGTSYATPYVTGVIVRNMACGLSIDQICVE